MMIQKLKAKIHRATVTDADLNYEGSITIDSSLLSASGIEEYEKVQVVNVTNGQRFETYTIQGSENSGEICLNGACARLAEVGDKIIVMAYCYLQAVESESFKPTLVFVNENNKIVHQNLEAQ